jgi:hypothetical protein
LYRPTLHQIHALHWHHAGLEAAFACVADGLEHVARVVAPEAAQALRRQLGLARRHGLHPRDARYPLVRSADLYPVPEHTPLRAAFFAYQDGTALLLHFMWHWDGDGDVKTFQALRTWLWSPAGQEVRGDLGEGLLLTAALQEPATDDEALAREMLAPFEGLEGSLTRLPLNGATLYVHLRAPLHPTRWPAVILFDSPEVERGRAADRLVTVEWPLVVLYHLRVERLYLEEYRQQVVPRLVRQGPALRRALEATFAQSTNGPEGNPEPELLASSDLKQMQRALIRLSGPQYALLDALSAAERCAHDGRRDMRNLEEAMRSALATPLTDTGLAAADAEATVAALTRRARHFVAQIEADASEARALAERAARAVDVLRTQADIIEADYERRLNWVIGLVGTAIAMAQLVDERVARALYSLVLARPLAWVGIPLGSGDSDAVILLIRVLAVFLSLLFVGSFLRFYLRPRRG